MEAISTMITNAVTVVGDAWTAMSGIQIIGIFVGVGLVSAGCGLFARMKRSAR